MKKVIPILLFVLFIFSSFNTKVFAKDTPPVITADDAVLMDGTTGEILYSKNPDAAFPPASTTKIMTALITLENSKLDDKVVVGKKPPFADGSKAGIREAEELTVKDLLYGLLFVSGNDCANALAEHIGGSMEVFVSMMNNRAKELGLENTTFMNPNGLYDANHRSSAKDLALIMRELTKHPEYSEIATDNQTYFITATNTGVKHPVSNEIQMAWKNGAYHYDGFEGGKTGYTIQSLFSYVVSAKRNGQRLIVAMHSETKNYYSDSTKLLNYGFKNFELSEFCAKGDKISDYKVNDNLTIPLLATDDFFYVKEKGSNTTPQISVNNKDLGNSSFSRGDNVLDANITLNNQDIGILKLASGVDHLLKSEKVASTTVSKNSGSPITKVLSAFLLTFICVIFLIRTFNIRRRRRRLRLYKRSSKYR
jgi:D-alanyl-D-alanine carboxypeptidase